MRLTLRGGGTNRLLAGFKHFNGSSVSKSKKGFTLAEVLITLTVIGVVAALTLPTLISTMHTKAMERKEKVFKLRLVHGLREMAVKSRLTNFDSTYDFAQELGQHYKYLNLCKSDNIKACYQVDEVTDPKGNVIKVSSIKTIKNLNLADDEKHEWAEPVAIVTTDGTPFIFSYNKKCTLTESDMNEGLKKDNVNGVILNCIAGVYDRNGVKTPNKQNDDITSINGATLAKGGIEIAGIKLKGAPFTPTPLTKAECEAEVAKGTLGIKECYFDTDYWAGAVKECGGVTKMPTMAQLGQIAQEMYLTTGGAKPTIGAKQYEYGLLFQPNSDAAKALGLTRSFYLWSGEEDNSSSAYNRYFGSNYSIISYYDYRDDSYLQAVCLGD